MSQEINRSKFFKRSYIASAAFMSSLIFSGCVVTDAPHEYFFIPVPVPHRHHPHHHPRPHGSKPHGPKPHCSTNEVYQNDATLGEPQKIVARNDALSQRIFYFSQLERA